MTDPFRNVEATQTSSRLTRDGFSLSWSFVAARLADVVMLLFLVAALAKLANMAAWADDLGTWTVLPRPVLPILAVSVPSIEMGLALAWFLRIRRRLTGAGGLALLLVFMTAAVVQISRGERPTCGCLGGLLAFEALEESAWWTVGRHAVLALMLSIGLAGARQQGKHVQRDGPEEPTDEQLPAATGRPGFSILELMLTLSLCAILLSLLAPGLQGLRDQARAVSSQANLRSHAAVFEMYASERAGTYPRYTDPAASYSVIRYGEAAVRSLTYFSHPHFFWNIALAGYYGGDFLHPSFTAPGADGGLAGSGPDARYGTGYWYSHTFIAAPAYWDPFRRLADHSQLHATRQHQVVFPSSKGILLDVWSYSGASMRFPTRRTQPVMVGFVDGSARAVTRNEILPEYPGGAGDQYVLPMPVMHTLNGVEGRDVR